MLKTLVHKETINYDGSQLQAHWIYKKFGLLGDAAVAFRGEVKVSLDKMIDLIDVKVKEDIYSPLMLNFIIEHFDTDLELAGYRQRLFMVVIKEELEQFEIPVQRMGDDLYVNRGKLSVSIATRSLVSTLIHVGLNIETEGTPVKTAGLRELGIVDIDAFADKVMLRYKMELEQIYEYRCKVKGIANES
ncbi:Protein of unknown function DUF366 [Syntrophomonas zehnderi OL-4]|uniref:DUF366 domain-containing protein n=1 Tax=Syntrophomonas zehnderi OL-4 TaxID=690567 RepID=A0A0E4C7F6_9FIRM|nr:DUF366 family protein [Syntrophomonas zehnderi]CFW97169.1 Protein of unknown function DUF366 [Syntrophomonas zehnderi OL-4]